MIGSQITVQRELTGYQQTLDLGAVPVMTYKHKEHNHA